MDLALLCERLGQRNPTQKIQERELYENYKSQFKKVIKKKNGEKVEKWRKRENIGKMNKRWRKDEINANRWKK